MPTPIRPTRRAVLGAVGIGLWATTTACDGPSTDRDTSGSGDTPHTPVGDRDEQLLDDARARVSAAATLVASTLSSHPRLRGALGSLGDLHATHATVLGGETDAPAETPDEAPTASPEPTRVPDAPAIALTHVLSEERTLADSLALGAREAQSGQFARLLATMSAGILVHVKHAEGVA